MTRPALVFTLLAAALLRAEPAAPAPAPLEQEVADIVAGPQVTLVHFWAPWCPNCKAEMAPDGWAKFLAANPDVKVVFIAIWHRDQDPAPRLRDGGLGAQPNLVLRTHPAASSRTADRLGTFLGLPVTWIPTTWVFRDGRLRYAFNYGEMRFDVLQSFVGDARAPWQH